MDVSRDPDSSVRSACVAGQTASSKADEGFIGWMRDMAAGGSCPVDTAIDSSYQAGYRASWAANKVKAQFLKLWNPLAREVGQPVFTADKI